MQHFHIAYRSNLAAGRAHLQNRCRRPGGGEEADKNQLPEFVVLQ